MVPAWLKLLGALRVLSVKFSLYVVTLVRILSDIRAFVAVLFIIIATFASVMHLLFVGDDDEDKEDLGEDYEDDDSGAVSYTHLTLPTKA